METEYRKEGARQGLDGSGRLCGGMKRSLGPYLGSGPRGGPARWADRQQAQKLNDQEGGDVHAVRNKNFMFASVQKRGSFR